MELEQAIKVVTMSDTSVAESLSAELKQLKVSCIYYQTIKSDFSTPMKKQIK